MTRSRGSILILVMFVLVVLGLVTLSFAYRVGAQTASAKRHVAMAKLRSAAHSAVALAMADLAENTNDFDHPAESWHTHPPLVWADLSDDPNADVTVDYQVIDEESKLNLLRASQAALEKIGMTPQQIAGLEDWMDSDDSARADGAESAYYLALNPPYRAANRPVEILEELLLIRGFSGDDFRGEDQNHNGVLDPNEDDGDQSPPHDNADGKLQLGWVGLLTCYGDGQININTAPPEVLKTLPISAGAVSQIVQYRAFDQNSGGEIENHVFRSPQDIDQLQGLSDADRDVLKQAVTFRSQHFRVFVRAFHPATGLSFELQAVVRTIGDQPEVVQWRTGP